MKRRGVIWNPCCRSVTRLQQDRTAVVHIPETPNAGLTVAHMTIVLTGYGIDIDAAEISALIDRDAEGGCTVVYRHRDSIHEETV